MLLSVLCLTASAQDMEVFKLTDGREFIGSYDQQGHVLTAHVGGGIIGMPIEESRIASRRPYVAGTTPVDQPAPAPIEKRTRQSFIDEKAALIADLDAQRKPIYDAINSDPDVRSLHDWQARMRELKADRKVIDLEYRIEANQERKQKLGRLLAETDGKVANLSALIQSTEERRAAIKPKIDAIEAAYHARLDPLQAQWAAMGYQPRTIP